MALLSLRAQGPLEALLRLLGLMLVIGLAVWGFWLNGKRNVERLNARGAFFDETGELSAGQKERVQAFMASLRADWGLEARVRVTKEPEPAGQTDAPDAKTLVIALCPARATARIALPPLLERALGPGFAADLEREHFPFHFAPGRDWRKGLMSALDLVEERLAGLKTPQPPAPQAGAKDHK